VGARLAGGHRGAHLPQELTVALEALQLEVAEDEGQLRLRG
jgi:hypothetical protein